MRPLIPKVRAGDILKGTRNLRNYLQTAATLSYVSNLSQGLLDNKKSLYRASKDERFLVTVNAWGMFGACSLDSSAVLLFVNPRQNNNKVSGRVTAAGFAPRHTSPHVLRMDSTIFSQWFIRTPGKITDRREWDEFSHYMWATLHLNLSSIRHENAPRFSFVPGTNASFTLRAASPLCTKEHAAELIRYWIPRGITRSTAQVSANNRPGMGYGPMVSDINNMRNEIRELCSNPRTAQLLKAGDQKVYTVFLPKNQ